MPLFKPRYMSRNEEKAYHFVTNLTDRELLAAAAAESPHVRVRKLAASRTADPAALAKIALSDDSAEVREAAALRLQDQKVLAEIAKSDEASTVRGAAINGLTDQDTLLYIAMTDPSTVYHNTRDGGMVIYHLRLDAVRKITNQEYLYDLTQRSGDICVSMTAAECLTSKKYLTDIVLQYIRNVPEKQDRRAKLCCREALRNENLDEQALFSGIIGSTCPIWMKCCAIQRLTDRAALEQLAKNDKTLGESNRFKGRYYPLREEAQRRLLQLQAEKHPGRH